MTRTLIKSLTLSQLTIPFNVRFTHAAASRAETASLWVEAQGNGVIGYGESCPREYVTNESLESGRVFFLHYRDSIVERVHDLGSLSAWAREHVRDIDRHPAAWCAIELALLDLIAKTRAQSVEALLGVPEVSGEFHYSAVLGHADATAFAAQLARYREVGIADFKLKLCGKLEEDQAKFDVLRQQGGATMQVRVDANNLWSSAQDAINYLRALRYPVLAIEEPLAPECYDDLAVIYDALGIKIILDESFLRVDQFERLHARPYIWMINLRVSKMGGLQRSLAVVAGAREWGIPLIVGAQVGETSLLTRAALTVASAARDILNAQEGAFGTRLLQRDVCEPSLVFGAKGVLRAADYVIPQAAGFGLKMAGEIPFRTEAAE